MLAILEELGSLETLGSLEELGSMIAAASADFTITM
jgi:hypothetical protein